MTWTVWNESSTVKTKIEQHKAPRLEHKRGAFIFSTSTFAAGKPGVVVDHMSKDKPGSGMALLRGLDNRVAVDSNGDHCQSCGSTSRLDRPMDRTASPEKPIRSPKLIKAELTRQPV